LASLSLLLYPPPGAPADGLKRVRVPDNPFFTQTEIIELTLELPLATVVSDRGPTPASHPALLTYRDATAALQTVTVRITVRGNRRKDPTVCGFPPLLVQFPATTTPGHPFGAVSELKLVTHCLEDTYTLREYLAYKLYNVLTDYSFRARLCRITYRDARGKSRPSVHYGFFLEPTEALAARHQATVIPKQLVVGMKHLNPTATATMALFQYMIGNTDWSVPYRHNTRLLKWASPALPVPVPFDFDYSGLVMAPYAVPPAQLGLVSVRQRLFRGHDFPPETYAEVCALFRARQAALFNVYLTCPYLSPDEKVFATRYLTDFYKTLNDPKEFERNVVRIGARNGKKYTHIRGFD
jgi:hypothetical protein